MSNGDDESADAPEESADGTDAEDASEVPATAVTAESLGERLDDAEAALENAETEADLDDVEASLDAIASDLEDADLEAPDENEDEEAEDPAEELQTRIDDLREELEAARGPYAEDVQAILDEAAATVRDTRWTEDGEPDVRAAVSTFLDAAEEELDDEFPASGDDLDDHAAVLETVGEATVEAGLDADDDEKTIAALLEAAETLEEAIEDAEEWADLTVVEQLRARGFYDRVTGENRKDFPPELNVVRIAEAENDPERVLMALEKLESDFMQENCIDALRRMAPEEAFEPMHEAAQKRGRPEIEVLGKIGDERAVDTLVEFVDSDNPPLQKVTLRALGEIGSREATQAVADALADDESVVRSQAARALGLIGDTRAIEPLADTLGDGEEETDVRAAAAWALVQIGTERALEAAAEYDDDRAYTVQIEAEKARDAAA
ncbi:HEAT repeat domain-containing protein [Natronomonas marina]|jgi:HEAT repeat protein|uniref:HEAT repeat domain-containing protein n=1 Tax=Natronomonas marina TaxID=2961939 RepID=UPI0020C9B1C6|nr:HEAT repeat domain-containing protein [Natronomonas marina]